MRLYKVARSRHNVFPSKPRLAKKRRVLTCTLAALSAIALPSCGASPDAVDSGDTGGLGQSSQQFKIMWPAPLPRIQKFLAGNTLRINLRGTDVTRANRASKQTLLTQALMAWVDAVRPVAKQPLITAADIVWTSTGYDIDINWVGGPGRAMANCGLQGAAWMLLYRGDPFEVALHEFGHIFQVHDTYTDGLPGCQPGQPHSVMCDNGWTFNTLQPDDIAAIRQVFRMAYPDLIDFSPLYSNLWNTEFGYGDGAGGWRVDLHPRLMADVNADGKSDIIGFGNAGAYVGLSSGIGFDPSTLWVAEYGYNSGWRTDQHPRLMADVNNDNRADIIGFGDAGVYVALSTGSGFASPTLWTTWFGTSSGWRVDRHPRLMADVNNDNRADIIGFGDAGVYVALSTGWTFKTPRLWVGEFGYNSGWRVESHPRLMADLNNDNKADIIGFGNAGTYVALSTGSGFSAPALWLSEFGYNSGWRVESHPRLLADMNGDHKADIVGFGNGGTYVSFSTGSGFTSAELSTAAYGYDSGWRVNTHPRMLADTTGDGRADIIGFGNDGAWVAVP
jgi:hypothetical protein